MAGSVRITTIVENTTQGRMLLGEHGLSFWIVREPHYILFDTGQGAVLPGNAHKLGVRLDKATAIVLSHGHYDHTGGLGTALRAAGLLKIYAHPAVFLPKYARRHNGAPRDVGLLFLNEETVRKRVEELVYTERPTCIGDGFYVTGTIPRVTDYEDPGGPFYTDRECAHPDPMPDDQALYFDSPRGTVVVLGCAHAGVINTLRYIRSLTNNRPIYMVIGGMHLATASPERIERTIADLRDLGVQQFAPAHCTGLGGIAALWSAFPGLCIPCVVGSEIEIPITTQVPVSV